MSDLGRFDALVVGSGVAGCTTALELVASGVGRVGLVTKGELGVSTTDWAQGGIAAVTSEEDDSIALHFEDTLAAGGGLCDLEATRALVGDGPSAVRELLRRGAVFDRDERGALARAREGGHSVPRVVHAGMATGAEVVRALVGATRASAVEVRERLLVTDLLVGSRRCCGVLGLDPAGATVVVEADAVVLATGGAGQLFQATTNPEGATGDGIAAALRAGVPVADLEFVQFHPTALATASSPRPLLSEGLRGYGALIVDDAGKRFVDELAPRDVVSRAIVARMGEEGSDHVYLDARPIPEFASRFPTLEAICRRAGLDPSSDLLPVAPAAHYVCGGVVTDLSGHSALPGLYAVGEAACTGAEGANRLASNSLLEGLVFAKRAARAIAGRRSGPRPDGALSGVLEPERAEIPVRGVAVETFSAAPTGGPPDDPAAARARLAEAMSAGAGVRRDDAGLRKLEAPITAAATAAAGAGRRRAELRNLATVAAALATAALWREESRGAHTRLDAPDRDDEHWRVRLAVALAERADA